MGASQSAAETAAGAPGMALSGASGKGSTLSVTSVHQKSAEVPGAACAAVVGAHGADSCIFALRVGPMAPKFKEHYVRMIGEAFDRPPTSKRGFARAILRGQLQLLVGLRDGARAAGAGEGGRAAADEVFVKALRLLADASAELPRLTRGVVKLGALGGAEDAVGGEGEGDGGPQALEAAAEQVNRMLLCGEGPWTDPRGMGSIATPGTALAAEPDSVPAPSLGTVTAADAMEVVSNAADRGLKWSKAQSQALVSVTYFGVVQAEFWAQVCFPRVRNAVTQLVARVAEVTGETAHAPRRLLNVALQLMEVSARLDTYEDELQVGAGQTAAAGAAAADATGGTDPATASAGESVDGTGQASGGAAPGSANGPASPTADGSAALEVPGVRLGLTNLMEEVRAMLEGSIVYGACGILGLQQWIVGEAVLRFKATVLDVMGMTASQTAEAEEIEKDAKALQAQVCQDPGSTSLESLCAELAWLRARGISVRGARGAAARIAQRRAAAAASSATEPAKAAPSEASGGAAGAESAASATPAAEAEAKEDGSAAISGGECELSDEEVAKQLPSLLWVVSRVGAALAPASTRLLDLVQTLLDKVLEERRMAAEAYADLMSACANNKEQAALVFDRVMAWGKDLNGFPSNLAYNILISCARSHDDLIAAINRMTALGAPMDSTICERVLRRYQGKPYTYYDLWALIQHNKDGFPDMLKNHKALSCFSFRFGPQCTSQEIIQIALRDHLVPGSRRGASDEDSDGDR